MKLNPPHVQCASVKSIPGLIFRRDAGKRAAGASDIGGADPAEIAPRGQKRGFTALRGQRHWLLSMSPAG